MAGDLPGGADAGYSTVAGRCGTGTQCAGLSSSVQEMEVPLKDRSLRPLPFQSKELNRVINL
ncbi:hypothetical protein EMIT0P43_150111 [Pseudomonas jessenii]